MICSGTGQSNRKSLLWRGTELNSKIIAHQKCFGREQKALDPKFNTSRSYSVIFSILHAKGKLCVDDPFPVGLQIGIMIDNLSKQQLAVIYLHSSCCPECADATFDQWELMARASWHPKHHTYLKAKKMLGTRKNLQKQILCSILTCESLSLSLSDTDLSLSFSKFLD